MKANVKSREDVGVSAVIGVILMVAITVAIAVTVYVYVQTVINEGTPETYSGVLYKVVSKGDDSKIVIGNKTLNVHGDITNLAVLVGQDVTIYVQDFDTYYTFVGVEVEGWWLLENDC